MFSEPDLRSVLHGLLRLAARKLQEVRERVVNVLKRCQSVLQGAADAEKLLALEFVSLRPFTTEVEVTGQRLGKVDYLACLELEKRVLQIRERLVVECTKGIQSEIANRRDAVKRMEDTLRQMGHQGELILAEARREGEALIEKARTQAEIENRQAQFALKASESDHAKTEQNSKIDPTGAHWGLGCLTHLLVFVLLFYLLYGLGPAPPNIPLLLWMFGGWIVFGLFYAWLATQFRIQAAVNAVSQKRMAAEQTKLEQEKVAQQARSAADNLLAKARSRSQAEFAERLSLLQEDLRQEENRVSQAESVLSTFLSLK